jgi:hypothetical protein
MGILLEAEDLIVSLASRDPLFRYEDRSLAPILASASFRLKPDRFILNSGVGMSRAWTARPPAGTPAKAAQ